MSFSRFTDQAGKFVVNNSTTILTTIGVVGTLTTAYLTGRASFKAAEIIAKEEASVGEAQLAVPGELEDLTTQEKVELVWRLYIPAAGTALLTVACIVAANRIGTRRAAALAAAYSLVEKMGKEYKDKVVEKIGASKEQKLRDELAQDRVNNNPVSSREVIITGRGDVLCYDSFTGRYFNSNMESIRKAQNDLNQLVVNNYCASLSDFYKLIGLANTSMSDDVGWNTDELLDIQFSTTLAEDGIPCIAISFSVIPIRGYDRLQ